MLQCLFIHSSARYLLRSASRTPTAALPAPQRLLRPLQAEAARPQGALARCAVCNCLFLMEAYALWPLSYSQARNPRPGFLNIRFS